MAVFNVSDDGCAGGSCWALRWIGQATSASSAVGVYPIMNAALLVLSVEIRGRSPDFVSAWKNSTVDRLLHFSTLNSFLKKKVKPSLFAITNLSTRTYVANYSPKN